MPRPLPRLAALLVAALAVTSTARGQSPVFPAAFPAGYLGHEELTAALRQQAAARPDLLRLTSLGKSVQGRDIWLASLGIAGPEGAPPRPAILIVANLEADHLVGSQVALGMIRRLIEKAGSDAAVDALLARATIHVIPRLDPDGAERFLAGPPPLANLRTNLGPVDRDRDGKAGEDGPDDLDADGVALVMRVRDLKASLVPDATDARILRPADASKGEVGIYSLYREGRDDDGDGAINEDPAGGVNLNRNWPARWAEFDPEAGWSPGAEPETAPLIRFLADHPEIAAVWTLSLNDTIRSEPKKEGSRIDEADLPHFVELSRRYNAALSDAAKAAAPLAPVAAPGPAPAAPANGERRPINVSAAPGEWSIDGPAEGSLAEWAYQQRGALAFATRVWAGPDIPDVPEGQPKPPADGEARWLYWNDKVVGGSAFVPMHVVEHPALGPVEVGGWRPGVKVNPPSDRVAPLTEAHYRFLVDGVARSLPRLELADVAVEPRGEGTFEVRAVIANMGGSPTSLAQGVRTGEGRPVIVRLVAPGATLLAGRPQERIEAIAGAGGRRMLRWLIQAPDTLDSVTIEAASPRAGSVKQTAGLR